MLVIIVRGGLVQDVYYTSRSTENDTEYLVLDADLAEVCSDEESVGLATERYVPSLRLFDKFVEPFLQETRDLIERLENA